MKSSRPVRAALVVAGLLLAACGGDDTASETATAESEPTTAPDDAGTSEEPDATSAPATTASSDTASSDTATDTASAMEGSGDECTEDRRGGTLRFAGISLPRGLDPSTFIGGGTVGGIELAAIYDVLMRYDPATGQYVGQVAESLEPNADFTEWTLVLRPGVTFGNGDPLTADAVKSHMDRLMANPATYWSSQLSTRVASLEVVDDLTMTITLLDSLPRFPFYLADVPGMIVNTAVVDAAGEEFALDPVGAGVGAYEVERFAPGEELVLVPKSDYWGGPVCPEQISFTANPNPEANYESFRNGDINFGLITRGNVQAEIKDAGENVMFYATNVAISYAMNVGFGDSNPPTADVRVRKAIQHALDLDLISERETEGFAEGSSALISEASSVYDGLTGLPYDPAAATALVDEVKAETGWDGSINLLCSPQNEERALVTQGLLDSVGFKTAIELVDTGDLVGRVYGYTGNFELACSGLAMTDVEIPFGLQSFRSQPGNYAGYVSPELDEALTQLSRAETDDQIKEALATIQAIWNETVPLVQVYHGNSAIYWADEVQGLKFHQKIIALLDDVYIEQ